MHSVAMFAFLAGMLLVADVANGAVAFGEDDTSDGFCDTQYGRIALGETHYPTEECVSVDCRPGIYHITGCGPEYTDDPNCTVVSEKGRHPNCCPTIKCTNE